MNNQSMNIFFRRRYISIIQSRSGRLNKSARLQALRNDINTAYKDKPHERPHHLLTDIEVQL